jgi:hypothetical protein
LTDPDADKQDAPCDPVAIPDRPPDMTVHLGVDRAGTLRASYMGPALRGEEGSDTAAAALIFHLNKSGSNWSAPERSAGRETGVDFVSRGPAGSLAIQVTRVPRDPRRWAQPSRVGHVTDAVDIPRAAQDLIEAIRHKGRQSRPEGNADVTLVLDGASTLAYVLENILNRFARE